MLITFQAFTIVWLGFGLGFIFMINLLMMDHIRGMSKQLMRSSKKSIKKLRRFAKRSAEGGPARFKEALQKKTSLKRVHETILKPGHRPREEALQHTLSPPDPFCHGVPSLHAALMARPGSPLD